MIVAVGFTPVEVTKLLPSKTKRLGMSCERPHWSTTESDRSSPIRALPSRCQPLSRTTGTTSVLSAPAASCASTARAMWKSSSFWLFSLIV